MAKRKYNETHLLVAIDCVIFGFDGKDIKLLVIHRGFEPEKGQWSLMGGFVQEKEGLDKAAARILQQLTGLEGMYMEQLQAFGDPGRDPLERTISIVYFALIDIQQYEHQLSESYKPGWFYLDELPELIFDHAEMVKAAKKRLQYKATLHPILFELLSEKFTIPSLLTLYEAVYDKKFDKRNFIRKLGSTGILIRQKDKEKHSSKKGAFYYKLDKRRYASNLQAFMSLLPTKDIFK